MRCFVLALLATVACASDDGGQKAMEVAFDAALALPASDESAGEGQALEMPMPPPEPTALPALPADGVTEQTIQTLDCAAGGQVRVTIKREYGGDDFWRRGYLRWEYDACGTWPYGVISGTASYTREVTGGPPWERSLSYHADLEYGGGSDGECNAYVKLDQTWETSEHDLTLTATCPHPVREWWDRLGIPH